MDQPAPSTIDAYIAAFPPEIRALLEQIRSTIRQTVPAAEETIRYRMPTFRLHDHNLVSFAAFKNHIGLYPTPLAHADFGAELAVYATGKGTLQFPLGTPIPFDLIHKIVLFRVQETEQRASKAKKS